MSTKENVAIGQLLSLLESRYAIRVLWALKDGHPQTFRLLQDSVGGITPNTLNTRIKEMREAGLLDHGSSGYLVTPLGSDLLKRMGDLSAFATKWAAAQAKKKAVLSHRSSCLPSLHFVSCHDHNPLRTPIRRRRRRHW